MKLFFFYNKGRWRQKNTYDALKDVILRIYMKTSEFRQLSMDDVNIVKPLISFFFADKNWETSKGKPTSVSQSNKKGTQVNNSITYPSDVRENR
jgi:hypothetical protein